MQHEIYEFTLFVLGSLFLFLFGFDLLLFDLTRKTR